MRFIALLVLLFSFFVISAETVNCENSFKDKCTVSRNTISCQCYGLDEEYGFWSDVSSSDIDRAKSMDAFCVDYADNFCSSLRNGGIDNAICSSDTGVVYQNWDGNFVIECYDNFYYNNVLLDNKSKGSLCLDDLYTACGDTPSSLLNYCLDDDLKTCVNYSAFIDEKCNGTIYDDILKGRLLNGEFVGKEGRTVAECCIKNSERSEFMFKCLSNGDSCESCIEEYLALDEEEYDATGSGGSNESSSGCSLFVF